jgi:acetyl esterase/lipase
MMKPYDIHPDFIPENDVSLPMNGFVLRLVNFAVKRMTRKIPLPQGIAESSYKMTGYHGKSVGIDIYAPTGVAGRLPCLVYVHGGGFSMRAAPHHKALACQYALDTPCKVMMIDYHLLPRNPFPAALEDVFAAYMWTLRHAEALDIDPARVAIGGDSAGAAIAIAACLMARDKGTALPCFQMLVYPVTSRRQNTPSKKEFTDTPYWNSKKDAEMWKHYLKIGNDGKPEYASPGEAASLEGMPPAYIEVAEFDCLHDEGVRFAQTLKEGGIPVELNETKRTVHGYDVAGNNEIVIENVKRRIAALQCGLGV